MKRLGSYILILLILVNIFAPFSVFLDENKNINIEKTIANAASLADPKDEAMRQVAKKECLETEPDPKGPPVEFCLQARYEANGTKVVIKAYTIGINRGGKDTYFVKIEIKDSLQKIVRTLVTTFGSSEIDEKDVSSDQGIEANYKNADKTIPWDGRMFTSDEIELNANESYSFDVYVQKSDMNSTTWTKTFPLKLTIGGSGTSSSGSTDVTTSAPSGEEDVLPDCVFAHPVDGTIMGCVAQVIYYAVFVPTSWLFGASGMFFDYIFAYSINDTTYRSQFVTEGWGIVRDLCNIFFIFILLYAAFKMILSIGHDSKGIIISVIIIGLLINFSLFAGQVMIDASNILARLFYNSEALKVTVTGDTGKVMKGGAVVYEEGRGGHIPISAAIINKVNPQNIIIGARKISQVTLDDGQVGSGSIDTSGKTNINTDQASMGAGSFLLITVLATIINVVGIVVFLSVGLMFVGRIIGLWFAMIVAPLAFLSYTVPNMRDMEFVGWKKWWPETLKLAFLAPIFMFFMYLMIMFLENGFKVIEKASAGPNWALETMIPFIFIMVFLLMAKKVAKGLSGTIGQTITKGVATTGALALGGAAIGTGLLLRKGIGQTMARASRGETLTQRYEAGTSKTLFGKGVGWAGSKLGLGKVFGNTYDVNTRTIDSGLGGKLNRTQHAVEHADHAKQELKETKEKAHITVDDHMLSGEDAQAMQRAYGKTKKSEFEADIRKGNVKGIDPKTGERTKDISEDGYKAANRAQASVDAEAEYRTENKIPAGKKLTADQNKQVEKATENKLSSDYNTKVLKVELDKKIATDFKNVLDTARAGANVFDRVIAGANKYSFDARKLSEVKADKLAHPLVKMGAGAIAGIAMGVRMGMNHGIGADQGKATGDAMKDLGNLIKDSLKNLKVEVKIPESSGGGHDDHGGGGGGGHH